MIVAEGKIQWNHNGTKNTFMVQTINMKLQTNYSEQNELLNVSQ